MRGFLSWYATLPSARGEGSELVQGTGGCVWLITKSRLAQLGTCVVLLYRSCAGITNIRCGESERQDTVMIFFSCGLAEISSVC